MAWGRLLPEGRVQRSMTAATFVNTIGNGMYMTVMIMYFTRSVGLAAGQVGLGLTVAGLAGLVAAVPVGHLADRRGPREVYVALSVVSAFVMVGFTVVHSFWPFLAVATVENLAASSSRAARGAMIARAGGDSPAAFRAYLRSVTNVGISLGGGVAALGLVFDTRAWYVGLILVNARTYLVNAAMTTAVPHLAPRAAPAGSGRWVALRDRRFLAVVAVMAVMTVQFEVLTFAAPLWISHAGHAPRWTVAALMVTNRSWSPRSRCAEPGRRQHRQGRAGHRPLRLGPRRGGRAVGRAGGSRAGPPRRSWCWPPWCTPSARSCSRPACSNWASGWPPTTRRGSTRG